MKCADRKYLLKEAQRTLDESDSTAAYCLCQRWILKDALAILKEQQEQIDKLLEESASNAEMAEGMNELLKEQEAKNVVDMMLSKDWFRTASCPKCDELLKWVYHRNHCGYCGQAVKWDA